MPNLDLLVIGDEYRWMYTDSVEIIIWYGLYGYDRPTIGQLLQRRGHKTARWVEGLYCIDEVQSVVGISDNAAA